MDSPMLFPYQAIGATFLAARNRALLCDEMGLGKTPQAIAACDKVGAKRVLVVCPAVVTENWRREFLRWQTLPRDVTIVMGNDLFFPDGVHIVSYDRARARPTLNALSVRAWDVLIVDEAHFVKTPEAARSLAVRTLADGAVRAWGADGHPDAELRRRALAPVPVLRLQRAGRAADGVLAVAEAVLR